MHKSGGIIIVTVFSVMCYYFLTPAFSCEEGEFNCKDTANMNADSNFGKIAEIEQSQSIAEPVVSERLKEQKEVLRQKELEEEKKIEYKKKLYEDRKEVVAEYESQRQKNK